MYLVPGTTHVITWSKQNLLDTSTYYVRAVIRDTRTDTVLGTVNLVDQGNGRFTYNWPVPEDPSGQGREIEIEKTVYEDSDYTVVSGMYGRWLDQYIIYDLNRGRNFGGGGDGVDYNHLRKIIAKALADKKDTEQESEEEKKEMATLIAEIGGVKKSLKDRVLEIFKIGEQVNRINSVEKSLIQAVEAVTNLTKQQKVLLSEIKKSHDSTKENTVTAINEAKNSLVKAAESVQMNMGNKVDEELTYVVDKFTNIMEDQATKIASSIDDKLSEPLEIQSVQNHQLVRAGKKEESKPKADERVRRLMLGQ